MAKWLRKLSETWRFLRYGPTEAAQLALRVQALEERLQALETSARHALEQHAGQLGALEQEGRWARNRVGGLSAALDRMQAAPPSAPGAGHPVSAGAAAAEEGFYPALEEAFRGSPEHVRQRQLAYRGWIEDLPAGPVGDLGCGRGEWLQLLREWGREPRGVDLNALNVEHAASQGLAVLHGDAVGWLQAQADESFAGLTAFHVVEHLPFGVLLRMVQEAARVLKPGGRLILETPNPENLAVATHSFWLDPTHQRPIPPALLELVVRHAGLVLDATPRLNPPEAAEAEPSSDPLLRSLWLRGRDYAVVARKNGSAA